jgi:hypothetical protein
MVERDHDLDRPARLLVLAVWFASSRWGAVVILMPDDDGLRFEPGAVLPIELTTVELAAVDDEPGVTRPEPEPHESKLEPRVPRPSSFASRSRCVTTSSG